MGKGLIDLLLDSIFDAEWAGRHGEKLTARELTLVRLFGRKGKVLRNVYVPKDNEETTEIDVVFITQKGIFVLESKNYSGWIFGDEKSFNWTAMLPNRKKYRFYNPIMQNRTHIKWLDNFLNDDIPLFSIIVFSERCELKKITVDSPDIHVIKRDRLYATIRSIWEAAEDKLDEAQVNLVYEKLKKLTNVDEAVKAAHIESINEQYQKSDKKPADADAKTDAEESAIPCSPAVTENDELSLAQGSEEVPMQCPRCDDGQLVLRTAKKGANAGNHFYGCSNYPKCRYIQNT